MPGMVPQGPVPLAPEDEGFAIHEPPEEAEAMSRSSVGSRFGCESPGLAAEDVV